MHATPLAETIQALIGVQRAPTKAYRAASYPSTPVFPALLRARRDNLFAAGVRKPPPMRTEAVLSLPLARDQFPTARRSFESRVL